MTTAPGQAAPSEQAGTACAGLRHTEPFGRLSREDTLGLVQAGTLTRFQRDELMFAPEDPPTLCILLNGQAREFRLSPDGDEITLAVVTESGLLGLECLSPRGKARSYTAASARQTPQRQRIREGAPRPLLAVPQVRLLVATKSPPTDVGRA